MHEDWTQDWKPENAKKIANAAITKVGPNFDAILASNDGDSGWGIQALSEEGLAGKILVTGQDAELSACQRIVNGTQAMTIYKPLSRLAKKPPRSRSSSPGANRLLRPPASTTVRLTFRRSCSMWSWSRRKT